MTSTDTLKGSVERITYYSEETGYCVLRLLPEQSRHASDLVTVVGSMPELQPGETVRLEGEWTTHPRHGRQFRAEMVVQIRPASVDAISRYLGSGLIKGVGPVTAKRIVDYFGPATLDVLDSDPGQLINVPGVGKHRAALIAQAWIEQQQIKEVMLFLQGHGVSSGLAVKIYKTYGDQSIGIVQRDPYRLARDIFGIGFRTADKIAQNLGLPADSPGRIGAGIVFSLQEATNDGHVYMPRDALVEAAAVMLEVQPELVENAIQGLIQRGEIYTETIPDGLSRIEGLYLPPMFYSEKGATARLKLMVETPQSRLADLAALDLPSLIASLSARREISLTAQQREAVRLALTNKISVLTGGPGTGKTTTLHAVIAVLERTNHRFLLASPTGRAAKRLGEATGHSARTIHRMLGFSPADMSFLHNEDNPLDADVLVVDEASMIDLVLFYNLLKAIKPDTHLLLVGDVDQLPSVGAGDVLRDVIRSGIGPVTHLDVIFRQAGNSQIIPNAHRINRGEMPDLSNQSDDFFVFTEDDPEAASSLLVDVVRNRIPARFGLDPLRDIQVLAPMYRGAVGVSALNNVLQDTLNASNGRTAERRLAGRLFRVGDKIIQTRNNYEKDVFNGDIGRVHSFDMTNQIMVIAFEDRFVKYDWYDADELTHAYCISVHRSQGSEYPCVVMPIVTQHYMMLQRNLLYTAVTRAKKLVVLVGTRKAVGIAVNNDQVARRWSALDWRLKQ
ncbi:MAG TPA: ATP-dependent RecD-like DNA helicase [Aggregatilinea sp.]|uniref:SF1B family DNA helicase RecD2 n=1 Tax=Aggregatilinea sp. TaxID=2806333 RepID=UPI002BF5AD95|nr:ATP-dependent RecD-like DNA helicase [Aggregatilinea sp.]HML21574.1 ATP-dependent RecD-like DNA helicase [Aggregatilinea sp.]